MDQENMWKIIRDNNFEINEEINADFLCAICHKILINACNNARCGCRYCTGCIKEYLEEENKACPGESEYCDKNQIIDIDRDILIDQPINIKISKLSVKCPNIRCQSKIELKSMENHMKMCRNQFLRCPYHDLGCKEIILTDDEEEGHLSTEINSHTRLLMECIIDYRNNTESLKKELDQLRNDNNDLKEKMRLSEERSQNQNEDMERLKSDNNQLKEKVTKTENIIENLEKSEKQNIDKLKDDMAALKRDNRYLEELKLLHNQITQHISNLELRPQMEKQSEEIDQLKNEVIACRKKNELLNEEMRNIELTLHSKFTAQLEQQNKEIVELKQCKVEKTQFDDKLEFQIDKISDIDIKLVEISKPIDKLQIQSNEAIDSIKEMRELIDKINYRDFVWKIDQWDEKRIQSKNGTTLSIWSDSFFSHRNGYKMCLHVYPGGNGTGKSTHLSIFFCIMKGPYDDILDWPFEFNVQISLINQQSGIDQATQAMKCSDHPDCELFIKPITEKNGGIGWPQFIKLEELSNNLELSEKNQIFIKCSVKP